MSDNGSTKKFIMISALSVLLSMVTVILGAPLLRVLRKAYGPKVYWSEGLILVSALIFLKLIPLVLLLGSLWVSVGIYGECEQRGLGWWKSGIGAVLSGGAFIGLVTALSFKFTFAPTLSRIQEITDSFLGQIKQANPTVSVDASLIVSQVPSVIVILLILGIGIGLIFEKSAFSLTGLPRERVASQLRLLEFKVPDYFIWIALTSLLLSVIDVKSRTLGIIGMNIVNVAALLYFFQGLAVVEMFLGSIKAGVLVRVIAYVILVGQLFIALSFIGLIDYWVDFRGRIKRYVTR